MTMRLPGQEHEYLYFFPIASNPAGQHIVWIPASAGMTTFCELAHHDSVLVLKPDNLSSLIKKANNMAIRKTTARIK
jgi:hypothetical protein